jgi:hypothetical protein
MVFQTFVALNLMKSGPCVDRFPGCLASKNCHYRPQLGSDSNLEPSTVTLAFTTDQFLACAKRLAGLSYHSQ